MISVKEILALPKEHRQTLQEIIGYSIAGEMNMQIFTEAQKKVLLERVRKYCDKKDAVFKYEEVKPVLEKLK